MIALQIAAGVIVMPAAWAFTGEAAAGWSAGYGVAAIALPSAVQLWALRRRGGAGPARFVLWQLIKLVMAVGALVMAPRVVADLNWLALLAGVILATQVVWVALAWVRRPRRSEN